MALVLHLKYAERLPGKSDRLVKVNFRGDERYSKVFVNAEDTAWINEMFEWPVARAVDSDEVIDIQMFNFNKYRHNRLIGTFRMALQDVIECGNVKISDYMLDTNNVAMEMTLTFELTYNAPDGTVGLWQSEGFEQLRHKNLRRGLSQEERSALNVDSSSILELDDSTSLSSSLRKSTADTKSLGDSKSLDSKSIAESKSSLDSKKSSSRQSHKASLSSAVKMMKSGKKWRKQKRTEDKSALIETDEGPQNSTDMTLDDVTSLDMQTAAIAVKMSGYRYYDEEQEAEDLSDSGGSPIKRVKTNQKPEPVTSKARDFQVNVTILEARQLAGLNMDPVVCVQVGDQKKYTNVKQSTNCPYYDEYFVFDFHLPPAMLFDKIVTLTVCQSGLLKRAIKPLGSFKLDVATVFAAIDHMFYHKWAVLTDPDDLNSGPKGYLKCDISVIGKGDAIKIPTKVDNDEDDIEGNLLLPAGMPSDRQQAMITVKIYKAEGLPKMNSGVMANVKKALIGQTTDLVDPFVQVSFAGHKGKTRVKKGQYEPMWNEQLEFTDMFPPLCRRIKIQLRDHDGVKDPVIGTHFLDLTKISNEGENGFLPTFGPCWVNLYGSPRFFNVRDDHMHLNDGLGEGVSYRGRLLLAVKTDILTTFESGPAKVTREPALPISENAAGRTETYFLFATILEATMIEKRLADKDIHFELSIGNSGNVLDGYNTPTRRRSKGSESDSDPEKKTDSTDANVPLIPEKPKPTTPVNNWHSTTSPQKPVTRDKLYYHMPFYEDKPCLYVTDNFEDHRRRLYNSNIIEGITEILENGITDVNNMVTYDVPQPDKHLRRVFETTASACSKYVSLVRTSSGGSAAGKTKLDKERHKWVIREMEQMAKQLRNAKVSTAATNLKEKLKSANNFLTKIRQLAFEPQHALPDVFLWMIANNKRIAYHHISAKDIIYSHITEERGRNCGKIVPVFLKLPGKNTKSQERWSIQAKLMVYVWLGLSRHKRDYMSGLPTGYQQTKAIKDSIKPECNPPLAITFKDKQSFQLRAHLFQARSLVASDNSGLSDPFAQICFSDQSKTTQVVEATLNPTWDEMLIMNEVTIYGHINNIINEPPAIIIEIFDQDRVGKAEFLGRAIAHPVVKMSGEKYEQPKFPPKLEWWDVYRGSEKAGELLAAFELLQLVEVGTLQTEELPPLEMPVEDEQRGTILPVPKGIRPTVSKHRIEVLFWGVRDLKRLHLTQVEKPRIDIECAGKVLSSAIIQNVKKNPNFNIPVKCFDVDLPDNELYCPPITIRCMDCRNFGRIVLAGTHVVNIIHRFMYVPTTKQDHISLRKMIQGPEVKKKPSDRRVSVKANDVAISMEQMPLPVAINLPIVAPEKVPPEVQKDQKTQDNNTIKKNDADGSDVDLDTFDWWSKYYASVELLIKDSAKAAVISVEEHSAAMQEVTTEIYDLDTDLPQINETQEPAPVPILTNGLGKGEGGEGKNDENKKISLKTTAKSVVIANKFSPAKHGKKIKNATFTKLKGLGKKVVDDLDFFDNDDDKLKQMIPKIAVYPSELENQPEFEGFKDWLDTFTLYRGKNMGDEETDEGRIVGRFKGSLKIYKIPLPKGLEDLTITGGDPQYGLFQGLPSNEPIKVMVRVYIIKANDLHPSDINGKADPYMVIKLGKTVVNDKDNYISKQLNPVFGKCFELQATFPQESLLIVQVYDWDLVGFNDLIGETKIDLENRFYSRHRATCSVSAKYDTFGYNAWRDPQKPTQILSKMCKDSKIDQPLYSPGKVRVADRIFSAASEISDEHGVMMPTDEHTALEALRHWDEIPNVGTQLVPEHVETRALYNADKPGIEQGKLEMWVDMFPMDMPMPDAPVDISPRKPKGYELRCIIWNTDDVILEDDAFFTGEKMSDIYVKGWLKGPEDVESTDIHYRSLTGEGNFNWRFIFPFEYLVAEEKIVISRKETILSWDETESRIPPRFSLQVWDADHFSADDFLGSLSLDLNRFPRGAKSAKQCSLEMLKPGVPQMSLFKHKRVKGWWPFAVKAENSDELELTGKVEAELCLMTKEEAEKHPAGHGRSEPEPLEKPNRPDTSFIWFLSPFKSLRYILWQNYKWVLLKLLLVTLAIAIIALFFYSMPGYSVKRLFGA